MKNTLTLPIVLWLAPLAAVAVEPRRPVDCVDPRIDSAHSRWFYFSSACRPRYHHFNSDAFWNTFWNIDQVWGLAYPDIYSQFVNFLLDMYRDGGLIPRGPSGHNHTFVMIGAHSTPFIVGVAERQAARKTLVLSSGIDPRWNAGT